MSPSEPIHRAPRPLIGPFRPPLSSPVVGQGTRRIHNRSYGSLEAVPGRLTAVAREVAYNIPCFRCHGHCTPLNATNTFDTRLGELFESVVRARISARCCFACFSDSEDAI